MKDYGQYTDEQLIQMLRGGDKEIADYLLEKYKPYVRRKARAMYLVGGDTDDLIQEGMLGMFKALRDYDEEQGASFLTFARLCMERQMYHAVQRSNRQKHQPLNTSIPFTDEELERELGSVMRLNPEVILIDEENAKNSEKKIRSALSGFENQVLDCYLQGMDYIQIAEKLGRPPKSIDNAIQRIRGKVRGVRPL